MTAASTFGDGDTVSAFSLLRQHADDDANAVAIRTSEREVRYGELRDRVARLCGALLSQSFSADKTTGIAVSDEVDHVTCALALLSLGVVQIALPSFETPETNRAIAARANVAQIITAEAARWMQGFQTFTLSFDRNPPANDDDIERPTPLSSIAGYRRTSGSTNVPKLFTMPLARLIRAARRMASEPTQQRVLHTRPVEFDQTAFFAVVGTLAGNTVNFLHNPDLPRLSALCRDESITDVYVSAYYLASLVREAGHRQTLLPAETQISVFGSRVPGYLRAAVRKRLTPNLMVRYGASEVGVISNATPDEHEAFPEGVGRPPQGIEVEIVDEDGRPLAPGEIGQIRIRTAGMAQEYIGDPVASRAFRDGWFYPGDLLARDESGRLSFHGRADDVINLNGIKILPSAIEDALSSHPDVIDVAAFAVRSNLHGAIPVAAIALAKSATDREPGHFVDFCRPILGLRGPRRVIVLDRLPRNEDGKLQRRELGLQ